MNKEITIYELLGKIRNGEVPKKIIYRDYLCYYDDGDYKIKSVGEWLFANEYIDLSNLNDKVEIIEDDYKLEKIKWNEKESRAGILRTDQEIEVLARRTETLKKSLNEIIGVLNERNMEKH